MRIASWGCRAWMKSRHTVTVIFTQASTMKVTTHIRKKERTKVHFQAYKASRKRKPQETLDAQVLIFHAPRAFGTAKSWLTKDAFHTRTAPCPGTAALRCLRYPLMP
ncbi:hypothetical protein M404DRAFT_439542 [Pisolithus tinctorius Marx 270]|uniref:Uncharacterized protein n=1 Tax=Pisolithus tinctorius Marx 270 TaxID=870435 RepID=A0A0C3P0V5_PISTI|nr:hypothetical protein M404DRAFT_439542 [Pisolithus tinctorius Marx 270]